MKILITGACGYVGTVLANSLLERGEEVVGFDIQWFGNYLAPHPRLTLIQGDIRNPDLIPWDGIRTIIHLANVANDPCSELNSKLNWEVNTLASMLLVEKAISSGVKQFIFASSGSVYGIKEEDEVTENLSLVPISDYNKTKMISERVLLSYSDKIIMNIIRPATICGVSPRMRLDLSVNMLCMQALTNKKITVLGGTQTRPNITLRDMIRVYHHFLDCGERYPGIFNAGFENISILDIAKKIQSKIPSDIELLESNDPRSYRLSSKKLLATGYVQQYSVNDAIDELIVAFEKGDLRMEDRWFNIKTMRNIKDL